MLGHVYSRGLCWSAAVFWAAASVSGAFRDQVVPVPMLVESDEIFTDLHLALKVEELGEPLLGRTPSGDPDLDRMVEFFEAVLTGDYSTAVELTEPVPQLPPETARQVVEAYGDLLQSTGGTGIRLERVVELGYDRLLVWSIPFDDPDLDFSRYVRSFRFLRDGPDGELFFEGARRDPLSILITSTYQQALGLPDGLPEANPADFEYGYDFPLENNGEPPQLLFNGAIVDRNVFVPSTGAAEPSALAFYAQAMEALSTGDPQQYASYFAPFSRERFEQWVAEMEPGAYEAFLEDTRQIGKNVYFVLNADPVYFLLHLPTHEGISGASFRYDVVWRNPDGVWQIVNFYTEGFFDDIIKDRALFEEPFLRPTLIAAEVIEDERKPLAVVPASRPSSPPPMASASPDPVLPIAPPPDTSGGLPRWFWGVIFFLILMLALAFWRQSASSADANTPSS